VTSTLSRSSTVRTPDLRTSWTPQRNSTKTFATFSKEPLLLFTSSFWVWAVPSTTLTLWSLSKNWVSVLRVKKLASKLHVHSVNFAAKLVHTRRALSSTVINSHQERAGFRPSLQPSWSPLIFPFFFAVEEFYSTWYQNGSFSLINVGSGFHCLRSFSFFFSIDYHYQIQKIKVINKTGHPADWTRHIEINSQLSTNLAALLSHDSSLPTIGRDMALIKTAKW